MGVVWESVEPKSMEEIAATLVNIEHREARRVSPGQGDKGIDVLLDWDDGQIEVWQVKGFAGRMNSSRPAQVKKSLETAVKHWGDRIARWHLVAPITPTLKELQWFKELTATVSFPCEWIDKTALDRMAAANPEIPAYFIDGKAPMLEAKLRDLQTILGAQQLAAPDAAPVRSAEAAQLLEEVAAAVNRDDPHFEFVSTTGRRRPPSPEDLRRDGAVAMAARWDGKATSVYRWFERFAGAAEQSGRLGIRKLVLAADEEPVLERYFTYGATVDVKADELGIDLPGMPLDFENVQVRFWSEPDAVRDADLPKPGTFTLLDVDGSVVSMLDVTIDNRTVGERGGATLSGTDTGGVIEFDIDAIVNAAGKATGAVRIRLIPVFGKRAHEVLSGLRFVTASESAQRLAVHLDELLIADLALPAGALADDQKLRWAVFHGLAENLVKLEPFDATGCLVIPTVINEERYADVVAAAKLVDEGRIVRTFSVGTILVGRDQSAAMSGESELEVLDVEAVQIGEVVVPLGRVKHTFKAAKVDGDPVDEPGQPDVVAVRFVPGTTNEVVTEFVADAADASATEPGSPEAGG